jgi:hypothetical protein
MMERIITRAASAAALGAGLIAGTFCAFSVFVMTALGRLRRMCLRYSRSYLGYACQESSQSRRPLF